MKYVTQVKISLSFCVSVESLVHPDELAEMDMEQRVIAAVDERVLEDAANVTSHWLDKFEVLGTREVKTVTCSLCGNECSAAKAHLHQDKWVGDECCWDERLRASE